MRRGSLPPPRRTERTVNLSLSDEDVELVPPIHRSLLRSVLAKFLFLTISTAVLLLVATELSMIFHVAWLDPRPMLVAARQFLVAHVPLDPLAKIFRR